MADNHRLLELAKDGETSLDRKQADYEFRRQRLVARRSP